MDSSSICFQQVACSLAVFVITPSRSKGTASYSSRFITLLLGCPIDRSPALDRLARTASASPARNPERPPDLFGCQSLVLAVVPFGEVGVNDSFVAEADQLAGLSCTLHGAAENESKSNRGEYWPHPLCKAAAIVGQRDVRRARVLPGKAPLRFSLPDREHAHVRLPGSNVVGLRRTNPRGRRFLPPSPAGDLGHIVAVTSNE